MTKQKILLIVRALFILLYLYTSISKLWAYDEFVTQLKQSPLLKSSAVKLAWMVPTIELLIVISLIERRWLPIGLIASFSLMLLFTGYIIAITQFTYYIPCSCGGLIESLPSDLHIALNLSLAAIAFSGIWLEKQLRMNNLDKSRSLIRT